MDRLLGCSGLAAISRYSIVDEWHRPFYTSPGPPKLSGFGRIGVDQGFSRIRIRPSNLNLTIDLFVTHMIPNMGNPSSSSNADITMDQVRIEQAKQLLKYIRKSNADMVIL